MSHIALWWERSKHLAWDVGYRLRIPREFPCLISVGLLTLAVGVGSNTAIFSSASSIESEIVRLEKSLKEKPITSPDLPRIASMVDRALKDARSALNAGRIYLSLEKLAQAEDWFQGARFVVEKSEVVTDSLPKFEAEWGRISLELTSLEDEARQRDWTQVPAALRAISETSQQRAVPLLEGGQGFATTKKPKDGLFYLGEAQGEAEFAKFVFSLNVPRKVATVSLRSLLPELQKLQEKTNAAFQPPRSIELHSRFIALNATLKLAGELDSTRAYAGALYQYLEATRHYALLDSIVPDRAKQAELRGSLDAVEKQLKTSGRDDSIAQIFVERAQSQIAPADGAPPSPDDWRSAQAVLSQVLPAYDAAVKPGGTPPRAFTKTINITLVRWPYT